MKRRVVITGAGALSPLGHTWQDVRAHLHSGKNAVRLTPEWTKYRGLNTYLSAPAAPFSLPAHYDRKRTRSMGRVSLMATRASELALEQSGLLGDALLKSGRIGVAYGSSAGTPDAAANFVRMIDSFSTDGINANTYIKMMSHSAAVNIGVFFGLTGRVVTTSSACTSGSQGIGYAYEMVSSGRQIAMVAGGGEELHVTSAAVFDTLFAASVKNDTPELTPRPFDKQRDGLVLGEGACTFVIEEYEHAKSRGAAIIAEIVGFGTNSDGTHVTQPNSETMSITMQMALDDAGITADAIGYICAHGTATENGDIAEGQATARIFGRRAPVSSLKSYMGHTLGACGALEAWMSIGMMNDGWFAPTLNLESPDLRCGDLDHIEHGGRRIETEYVMSNNFAFGGVNTALIFRRWNN